MSADPSRICPSPGDLRPRVITARLQGTGTGVRITHDPHLPPTATPVLIGPHGKAVPASPLLTGTVLGPSPFGYTNNALHPVLLPRWLTIIAELLRLTAALAHTQENP